MNFNFIQLLNEDEDTDAQRTKRPSSDATVGKATASHVGTAIYRPRRSKKILWTALALLMTLNGTQGMDLEAARRSPSYQQSWKAVAEGEWKIKNVIETSAATGWEPKSLGEATLQTHGFYDPAYYFPNVRKLIIKLDKADDAGNSERELYWSNLQVPTVNNGLDNGQVEVISTNTYRKITGMMSGPQTVNDITQRARVVDVSENQAWCISRPEAHYTFEVEALPEEALSYTAAALHQLLRHRANTSVGPLSMETNSVTAVVGRNLLLPLVLATTGRSEQDTCNVQ